MKWRCKPSSTRRIGFRDIDRVMRRVMDENAARRGHQHRGGDGAGRARARAAGRIVAAAGAG